MSPRALHRRVADLARRQAEAAEHHAATAAVVDAGHAERVAFLMMVPEDPRMAVGIALSDPDGDESLHSWALWPFARWATGPAGFHSRGRWSSGSSARRGGGSRGTAASGAGSECRS